MTNLVRKDAAQVLVVRAEDDLAKPRGKQDWQLEPHSIWYPRTTGIWQTVWYEIVPETHRAHHSLDAQRRALGNRLRGAAALGKPRRPYGSRSSLTAGDTLLCDDTYQVLSGDGSTVASRSPIPASTIIETGCCGTLPLAHADPMSSSNFEPNGATRRRGAPARARARWACRVTGSSSMAAPILW